MHANDLYLYVAYSERSDHLHCTCATVITVICHRPSRHALQHAQGCGVMAMVSLGLEVQSFQVGDNHASCLA